MRKWILPLLLLGELAFFARFSGVRFDSFAAFAESFGWYCSDMFTQATPLLVLALGMTIVLMSAGIDLSVASMTALVACVMSSFSGSGAFWYTAVPTGLLLAIGLGLFNGFLIGRLDIPPIIATLGTLIFFRGLCEVVMRGQEKAPFYDVPGYEWIGGVTGSAVVVALLAGGGLYFQHSRWRREILMLGGNRVAARYAGIPVQRRLYQVYALMGALAFVAALCASFRSGSVKASWQTGLELQVIVAVVLGGTRVDGGSGSIIGSMLGVLLIAVLEEGLRGASQLQSQLPFKLSHMEYILLGLLLVLGVWLNTRSRSRVS